MRFLQKVSTELNPSNGEKRKLGASSPLFRLPTNPSNDGTAVSQLKSSEVLLQEFSPSALGETFVQEKPKEEPLERVRAAIHMDAVSSSFLLDSIKYLICVVLHLR